MTTPLSLKTGRRSAARESAAFCQARLTASSPLSFPRVDHVEITHDLFVARKRFHEVQNALAHARIGDLRVGADELESFGARHEFHHVRAGFQVLVVSVDVGEADAIAMAAHEAVLAGDFIGHVVEEVRHGHGKDLRNIEKAARPDPVRSLLVFLDLLECKTEKLTELFLAHSDQHAAKTNAATDMGID